jgi:hypothetical protein
MPDGCSRSWDSTKCRKERCRLAGPFGLVEPPKIRMPNSSAAAKPLVLIGFAEAQSAPEVAWSLADAGFEVFSFGRRGRRSALRQSHYARVLEITAPETNAEAALADLSAIAKCSDVTGHQRPCIVLPLDDASVWLCGRWPALPEGWLLAGPLGEATRLPLDKRCQIAAAKAAGFQVPDTFIAGAPDEALRHSGPFPLILRPAYAVFLRDGRLQKGRNWICANRAELEKAVAGWQSVGTMLLQPFVGGTGEGIFGFATARGIKAWSAHRRLRMMNPHGSGSSACVSQPVPAALKGPVEYMIRESGWRGLFMVELLRDQSGSCWFVEFNGRPWGSMALSRRQGLEYPAWNVRLALDAQWEPEEVNAAGPGLVCRNLGREIMHLLFVLRGRNSTAIQNWPSFWRSFADVLRIRRRDSFYNFRRDDLGVFMSDCCCTIRDQIFKQKPRG